MVMMTSGGATVQAPRYGYSPGKRQELEYRRSKTRCTARTKTC